MLKIKERKIMSKIIFLKEPSLIYDCDFLQIGNNQVRLVFKKLKPSEEVLLSGFQIVNEYNNYIQTRREDYIYLYRTYEDGNIVELCNDNSTYVEPKHTVKFIYDANAELEGESVQEVYNYEELTVPTVTTETGYEFVRWNPELPSSGKIEKDETYRAVIVDKNVYFYCDGDGSLDGETKQFVTDYSELEIPTPIANEDYTFISWSPEIPESGEIDSGNNHFYAIFKSNISERLSTVEGDVTSTQLALTEVFETTINNSQQLTDVQMALTELYEQTLSL